VINIPFLKKLKLPGFSSDFLRGKPESFVGIDIGMYAAKVVQLKYQKEKAILETYGELLSRGYLKEGGGIGGGFLRYLDADIVSLVKDVIRESNVTAEHAIISVPASSCFVTTISLPYSVKDDIDQAVPYEARKYVPIPISEAILDWDVIETKEGEAIEVLLVAVPRELIDKFKRIADQVGIKVQAIEVETLSLVRSLMGDDPTPTAIINMGHQSTTLAIIDKARLRVSHSFGRGSQELTRALERGLGVSSERAEEIKKEIGLSERIEEKGITSIIDPLVEVLVEEIQRMIAVYNRKSDRKVQKINLTGGGSNLKGIIDKASTVFGVEVTRGNPFARVATPAFMQPILREIGPDFSVATGLALYEIATR